MTFTTVFPTTPLPPPTSPPTSPPLGGAQLIGPLPHRYRVVVLHIIEHFQLRASDVRLTAHDHFPVDDDCRHSSQDDNCRQHKFLRVQTMPPPKKVPAPKKVPGT